MSGKHAYDVARQNLWMFDPEDLTIIEDREHPLFDPRGLEPPDPELVAGIKFRGVLEPVVIISDRDTGKPIVVAGRRRVLAARQANKELKREGQTPKKIPAVQRKENEREAVAILIMENAQRKDPDLLASAELARRAMTLGYSEEDVGVMFGRGAHTISQWLKLLETSTQVQKAVRDGSVRLADAVKLAKLPRVEQAAELEKIQEARPTRASRKAGGQKQQNGVSPAARLRRIAKHLTEHPNALADEMGVLIAWVFSEARDGDLVDAFPGLKAMFAGKAKAA